MTYIKQGGQFVKATRENPSRRKPHSWWAGYVTERKNPITGDYTIVVKAVEAHLDTVGGPWVAICNAHSTLMNLSSLKLAREFMKSGSHNWCEECAIKFGLFARETS